jgi:hypothetical protein
MATSQECPLCRTRIITAYVLQCSVEGSDRADWADFYLDNVSSESIGFDICHTLCVLVLRYRRRSVESFSDTSPRDTLDRSLHVSQNAVKDHCARIVSVKQTRGPEYLSTNKYEHPFLLLVVA